MAYYQFSLPMSVSDTYGLIKTVCEKSCTIKQECPTESIEVRTKFRMGKGSLPFVFYLRETEDGTAVMVSSDNATLTGALAAMNGNKPEAVWDLPDKEWSDLIEDFCTALPSFPLQSGKPTPVAATPCDDGLGQESVSKGKNMSLGRAAVGGMLFGGTGALVGGLSGTKKTTAQTRNVFSSAVLFRVLYSNGRVIEKEVKKNSREYAELTAKSV